MGHRPALRSEPTPEPTPGPAQPPRLPPRSPPRHPPPPPPRPTPAPARPAGGRGPSRLPPPRGRLRAVWASSPHIAAALLVLMALLAGMTVMTYGSVHTRWAAGEVLPRLMVGAAAATLSWWLINTGLGLSVGVA